MIAPVHRVWAGAWVQSDLKHTNGMKVELSKLERMFTYMALKKEWKPQIFSGELPSTLVSPSIYSKGRASSLYVRGDNNLLFRSIILPGGYKFIKPSFEHTPTIAPNRRSFKTHFSKWK